MKIYPSTAEHYIAIAAVWQQSVLATHHFLSPDFTIITKPLLIQDYLPQVDVFHVTNNRDEIIGFIGVANQKIEMLFIHPDVFGKGIGKLLLQFAIHELSAHTVDVNEQNKNAVGFYLKMGFKQIGRSEKDAQGNDYPILHLSL
ncbi:MAG: acetyltransferase [Chitinophagaceae bacterium]|nr:acetyltransferase [Chitinophagaceae bacterium]